MNLAMMHKPVQIKDLELSFPNKICFENFNYQITHGSRIAIVGRNGSGKSTLLKMIAGRVEPSGGVILRSEDVIIGYVPQVIEDYTDLSGGQRLNALITVALSTDPTILLLDEPTNHLDKPNRKSLMRMLQSYKGTLIVVSHDTELLCNCTDTLWHIDNGKIHVFYGSYNDYIHEIKLKRASINNELARLDRQKKEMHDKLMQEQQRIAKSRAKGEKKVANRKWLKLVGDLKGMKAEKSQGRKLKAIDDTKDELATKLIELRLTEIILPTFSIDGSELNDRTLIQISGGSVGYCSEKPLLSNINLNLSNAQRISITGQNGSGKSTLIKAILGSEEIHKTGEWYVIKKEGIGYLDQHYTTLDREKSVFDTIAALTPHWSHTQIRRHLNDFLFRKNEEVSMLVSQLSGGEKARLSLAQIAAKTPKLLILDEITNNLDLETKEHVIQVLQSYPGAMIIISHDTDFLKEISVHDMIDIAQFAIL